MWKWPCRWCSSAPIADTVVNINKNALITSHRFGVTHAPHFFVEIILILFFDFFFLPNFWSIHRHKTLSSNYPEMLFLCFAITLLWLLIDAVSTFDAHVHALQWRSQILCRCTVVQFKIAFEFVWLVLVVAAARNRLTKTKPNTTKNWIGAHVYVCVCVYTRNRANVNPKQNGRNRERLLLAAVVNVIGAVVCPGLSGSTNSFVFEKIQIFYLTESKQSAATTSTTVMRFSLLHSHWPYSWWVPVCACAYTHSECT